MFAKVFSILRPLLFPLCFILLAGGFYFFYQQTRVEQTPVKLYKVTTPLKKVDSSPENLQESSIESNLSSPSDVQLPAESEEALPDSNHLSQESGLPPSDAIEPEQEADTSLLEGEAVELSEESAPHETVLFLLDKLEKEITEKYPEFLVMASMSMEEIQEVLSIPGERERLGAMAREAQTMYFTEMRDLLSKLPPDTLEDMLEETRNYLTRSWGVELTDALIIQLRQEFGL